MRYDSLCREKILTIHSSYPHYVYVANGHVICQSSSLLQENLPLLNVLLELERSQEMALSLEEKTRQAECERNELTEAQMRAEEARRRAEQAAHLEKEERERKAR